MKFSYNWLQSYFKEKLPKPYELAKLLTIHSFEVEGVKEINNDFILDLDILPNRAPDCSSHLGIAREIAVILDQSINEVGLLTESVRSATSEIKTSDEISLDIQEAEF